MTKHALEDLIELRKRLEVTARVARLLQLDSEKLRIELSELEVLAWRITDVESQETT